MGTQRLGRLPRTRDWKEVIALIAHGASAAQVATATLRAAGEALRKASKDKGVLESVSLLAHLPYAARQEDFTGTLSALGVHCPSDPDLFQLAAALSDAIDARLPNNAGRTDLGELAQMATVESLFRCLPAHCGGLFGHLPGTVRAALAGLANGLPFGLLLRTCFGRLAYKALAYFLSRELASHVGGEGRFRDLAEVAEFDAALQKHCEEASAIVAVFAERYVSKWRFLEGGLSPERVRNFVHGACEKLLGELRRRATDGGE